MQTYKDSCTGEMFTIVQQLQIVVTNSVIVGSLMYKYIIVAVCDSVVEMCNTVG